MSLRVDLEFNLQENIETYSSNSLNKINITQNGKLQFHVWKKYYE